MIKTLLIAGGCFWGVEELFRVQPGVEDTEVGYAGGKNANPVYEYHPGHAEALLITYDDKKTTIGTLLDYFFQVHDPTTKDRQGNDIGTSYRSAIFYSDDSELDEAKEAIKRNQKYWNQPIVTSLEPRREFYPAEGYHQDYLQRNPGGYTCHYERPR